MATLLEVRNLIIYSQGKTDFTVVNGIRFTLNPGETLGVIGESGCGKSLTCLGLLGLLDSAKWRVAGDVLLEGSPLALDDNRSMRNYRGNRIALIMQNPLSAFNQMIPIAAHFYETLNKPGLPRKTKTQVTVIAHEILRRMRIRDPLAVLDSYAFQLSGGMLQRIMIALALVMRPDILIADEPTTALDLTVQHEIIAILKEMQESYGTAILLVSHDLGVVTHLASSIAVMYAGEFVEKGTADRVLSQPVHPYTRGLFASRPQFSKERLSVMEGQPPSLTAVRKGCAFYQRCKNRAASCLTSRPAPVSVGNGQEAWCAYAATLPAHETEA
jgi:oligopeptide/dipeptide ABC transporter ATP-binding protein